MEHLILCYIYIIFLQASTPQVLVLDEIGKMEMFSQGFVTSVQRILAQPDSTVLTTIPIPKGKPIPLVEQIRSNKNVFLVNVSINEKYLNMIKLYQKIVHIIMMRTRMIIMMKI